MVREPLAYFITFTCYGTWLHGDIRGSVDRTHNKPGELFLAPDEDSRSARVSTMVDSPYYLDSRRRQVVVAAIREVARNKDWRLWAVHVRTNHVHVVVTATGSIERVMNDIKTAASRRLNKAFPEEADRKRWTRHGSTIYLWTDSQVEDKVDYTLNRQGEPMERYPEDQHTQARSEPRTQVAQRPE